MLQTSPQIHNNTSPEVSAYINRTDIVKAFTNFPNSKHKALVAHIFYYDEHKKLKEFTELLTPDGWIAFGNNPKVVGRQKIEQMLIAFNKGFQHLSQHLVKVYWDTDDELVYEADATYTYHDGTKSQAFPYMIHLKFAGDLVSDYRIFIDLGPFFQKVNSQ